MQHFVVSILSNRILVFELNSVRLIFCRFVDLIIMNEHFSSSFQYLQSGWLSHYSLKCQPVDYSNSPLAMRVRKCTHHALNEFIFSIYTLKLTCVYVLIRWQLRAGGTTLQNLPNSSTPCSLFYERRPNMFPHCTSYTMVACRFQYG